MAYCPLNSSASFLLSPFSSHTNPSPLRDRHTIPGPKDGVFLEGILTNAKLMLHEGRREEACFRVNQDG